MELKVGKEYWIKAKFKKLNDFNEYPFWFEAVDALDGIVMLKNVLDVKEVIPKREKVTIPKFVADYIEGQRSVLNDFVDSIEEAYIRTKRDVANWLSLPLNQEKYARAWFDGYEVKKEQLYWVRDKGDNPILLKWPDGSISSSSTAIDKASQRENKEFYALTEQEIKDYDERYWVFAVPVEEDDE